MIEPKRLKIKRIHSQKKYVTNPTRSTFLTFCFIHLAHFQKKLILTMQFPKIVPFFGFLAHYAWQIFCTKIKIGNNMQFYLHYWKWCFGLLSKLQSFFFLPKFLNFNVGYSNIYKFMHFINSFLNLYEK